MARTSWAVGLMDSTINFIFDSWLRVNAVLTRLHQAFAPKIWPVSQDFSTTAASHLESELHRAANAVDVNASASIVRSLPNACLKIRGSSISIVGTFDPSVRNQAFDLTICSNPMNKRRWSSRNHPDLNQCWILSSSQ